MRKKVLWITETAVMLALLVTLQALTKPVDDSRFPGLTYLVKAMGGKRVDWRFTTHTRLIALLKEQVEKYPEEFSPMLF